jgi:HSP20 family molecular chaperone IbpA
MTGTAEVIEVNSETPEKTREAMYRELRRDLAEWMDAKQDLVLRPAIELTEEGDEFTARALVPGVTPRDVEVMVTPERLLIMGEKHRRKFLRSIEFPKPVDPDRVHAEITGGTICVRARIAGASKVAIFRPRAA